MDGSTVIERPVWQPDYLAEYNRRLLIMTRLQGDLSLRRKVMLHWQKNPADWINDVVLTYDPRAETMKTMPFILFPRQREFITFVQNCRAERESGLVEKCRDAGLTWLACSYSVWAWLYEESVSIGFGSRKEILVDRLGDPDSIFGKLRMIIDNIPTWMKPRCEASHMKIVNLDNGATMMGEAGPNIGRGGRKSLFWKDESSHYEQAPSIEAALSATTDVQMDISSVNGSDNVFYNKRMAGQVWEPGLPMDKGRTRVFIFDWRDDPRKTQEWYDLKRKKAEDEGLLHLFAQEVDRDYSGSKERIIIPNAWVRAAIDAHIKLGMKPAGERIAGQDIADGGGDKNALAIRHGVILQHVSHWGGEAGDAPSTAIPLCIEHRVNELFYDSIGVGAGFKTGANTLKANGAIPLSLKILPWNAAESPQDPTKHVIPGDKQSPTNEDQYGNLKAQAWFRLRTRFLKTYNAVTKGEVYPLDELISLPSDLAGLHELSMELSQAVYKYSAAGKTIVDKVGDGNRSPNLADAVVMCFNPVRGPKGFF